MIIILISYILNIDLQCFFIMVEVLGELKSLVIKGEDRLKEGQHLKRSQHREELLFRIKKNLGERQTHEKTLWLRELACYVTIGWDSSVIF